MMCFRLYVLLAATMVCFMAQAQYARTNYDAKTIAAMAGAYSSEAATERYYNNQIQEIFQHYKSAEVAAAGIFASKFLDRKAMTDLGLWASPTENYYYKRIYRMVSRRIIPKIWKVTRMLLKEPQQILYWGPYIMQVCNSTQSLCKQFESVVSNSTLSFSDLPFPEIAGPVADLLDLRDLGDTDWSVLLHEFADISDNFTAEKFKEDFTTLYKNGAQLGVAGSENVAKFFMDFVQGGDFSGLMTDKIEAAIDLADNSYELYRNLDADLIETLNGIIGTDTLVENLLKPSLYNVTSWINDYYNEFNQLYYTQRWYIHHGEHREFPVTNYTPPTSQASVTGSPEWTRFLTTKASFTPNSSQLKLIQSNSEKYAGITEDYVKTLNRDAITTGYTYTYRKTLLTRNIYRDGMLEAKAYAYAINVNGVYDKSEVVYEAVFNSFTMDLETFKAQLEARLEEFNQNEDNIVYTIGKDKEVYFEVAENAKLRGSKSATISVTCSGGATLGEGSTQYKCGDCGKSVNSHTRECSMKTTLPEDSPTDEQIDVTEIEEQEKLAQEQVNLLETQIQLLEQENADLALQADTLPELEAAPLLSVIRSNEEKIAVLQSDLDLWNKNLKDIQNALTDSSNGEQVYTDEYTRIPSIMNDCATAYELTWQSSGSWQGNTFVRTATMPNINGTITFRASISIARKPKYFLGIKIHRAIVQISWELTSDYSDSQVVDVVELDPTADEASNAAIVNEHIAEVASAYPGCTVTTEYQSSEPPEGDSTDDTYHLLWSSDRLEIARQIDSKIHRIYADLIILERFLHYKHNIIDILKDVMPYVDVYHGRRYTLFENCRRAWLRNAAEVKSSNSYNNQWDEPLEDERFKEKQ